LAGFECFSLSLFREREMMNLMDEEVEGGNGHCFTPGWKRIGHACTFIACFLSLTLFLCFFLYTTFTVEGGKGKKV
jgi:hypothetical protein